MITLKETVIVDFETKLSEFSTEDYWFWIKKTVAEVVDQVPIVVTKMIKRVLKIPSRWLPLGQIIDFCFNISKIVVCSERTSTLYFNNFVQ